MKKKTILLLLGAVLMIGCLGGCGEIDEEVVPGAAGTGLSRIGGGAGQTEPQPGGEEPAGTGSEPGQGHGTPAPEELFGAESAIDYSELSGGINTMTFRMYDVLPREGDLIFSGYSIASALGMLELGADGECRQELDQLLGIRTPGVWHTTMSDFIQKPWSETAYVLSANKVWMDDAYSFQPNMQSDFGDWVEACYLSSPEVLNLFADGAQRINAWADEKTKGLIPQIVEGLSPDTVMVLTNAVYFKGKWNTPFDPDDTREEVFHGQSGDVTRDTMHLWGEWFGYQETDKFYGLRMDYEDSTVCMKVFLAKDETLNSGEVFAALSAQEKQALLDGLDLNENREEISHLQLPSWTTETSLEKMKAIFAQLGLERCFDKIYAAETGGDFTRIGDYLAISDILHKAKIIVAEDGTEAAAVTAVMMDTCAAVMMDEKPTIDFIADRPFVYVIQDTETGVVLFLGVEND